jgi:hypothetical protein
MTTIRVSDRSAWRTILGAAMALLLVAPTGSPASAEVEDPNAAPLREFWTEYGVAPETQDALIERFATTGSIDALVGDLSTAVTTTRQTLTSVETIYTYPDGSITVVASQRPRRDVSRPGVVTPMSTVYYGDCTTTSGSGWIHYANCNVEVANGYVYLKYTVTWEKYSSGPAQLNSSGSSKATCYYGSCTAPVRALWRPQSTSTQEAVVKYSTTYTAFGQRVAVHAVSVVLGQLQRNLEHWNHLIGRLAH